MSCDVSNAAAKPMAATLEIFIVLVHQTRSKLGAKVSRVCAESYREGKSAADKISSGTLHG
jgi:hypothetical protein